MKSPMDRYMELIEEYPHLFQNQEENGLVIITDRDEIHKERDILYQRLIAQGKPADWLEMGVLVEDPWYLVIRDLVRFPGGQIGSYLRKINRKSLQGGFNVVMLPRCGDRFLLLHHFRHEDRSWHWEFPRGFGEPGLSAEAGARKEIQEELGVSDVQLHELQKEMQGPDGGTVFYFADIPADAHIELEAEEGISKSIWLSKQELEDWIRSGEMHDMFSMKVYLLFLMKNHERV